MSRRAPASSRPPSWRYPRGGVYVPTAGDDLGDELPKTRQQPDDSDDDDPVADGGPTPPRIARRPDETPDEPAETSPSPPAQRTEPFLPIVQRHEAGEGSDQEAAVGTDVTGQEEVIDLRTVPTPPWGLNLHHATRVHALRPPLSAPHLGGLGHRLVVTWQDTQIVEPPNTDLQRWASWAQPHLQNLERYEYDEAWATALLELVTMLLRHKVSRLNLNQLYTLLDWVEMGEKDKRYEELLQGLLRLGAVPFDQRRDQLVVPVQPARPTNAWQLGRLGLLVIDEEVILRAPLVREETEFFNAVQQGTLRWPKLDEEDAGHRTQGRSYTAIVEGLDVRFSVPDALMDWARGEGHPRGQSWLRHDEGRPAVVLDLHGGEEIELIGQMSLPIDK